MAPDAFFDFVGAHDHGERVPPDEALDTTFHFLAAREWGLAVGGNGVLVGSRCSEGEFDAGALTLKLELLDQASYALGPPVCSTYSSDSSHSRFSKTSREVTSIVSGLTGFIRSDSFYLSSMT